MNQAILHWRTQIKQNQRSHIIWMLAVLLLGVVLGFTQGAMSINMFAPLTSLEKAILFDIRAPRVLMTVVTGAGLALCGVVLQALCRNPLADPGIVGVSSFAALFASIAIVLSVSIDFPDWLGLLLVPSMAFIGAASALMLLLAIAGYKRAVNTLVLILTGVALNAGAATLLGLVVYLSDDETLRVITFWQLGSYSGISWSQALIATIVIGLAASYLHQKARPIMVLQLGENHARFQGIAVNRLKRSILALVALVTAISVCFTGIVGFVGLVVPHITRMVVGSNLTVLLPSSMVVGATLVTLADVAARLVVVPAELPIGLLTSALGVPFFLGLILREKKKFSYD